MLPLACQQRPRRVLDPSLVPPSQRRPWTPSQCSWNLAHFVLLGHRNGLTEQLKEATKMSRKTGLSQTFKERAEECTRLSATAPLDAVREEYRTLASQYLALADAQRPRAAATKSRSGVGSSASVRELRPEGRPLLKEARRAHSYFNKSAWGICAMHHLQIISDLEMQTQPPHRDGT
jgi:hypothetical protein